MASIYDQMSLNATPAYDAKGKSTLTTRLRQHAQCILESRICAYLIRRAKDDTLGIVLDELIR